MARNKKSYKGKNKKSMDDKRLDESKESISDKELADDVKKPDGGNDPRWYSLIPQLTRDAARIPFSWPTGSKPKLITGSGDVRFNVQKDAVWVDPTTRRSITQVGSAVDDYTSIPGLVSLMVKSTLGVCGDNNDALNTLSQMFYTQLRFANSGRKNYEPADAVIYLLAIQEIDSYISWCQKLYDAAFVYSQENYSLGEDIIIANNVDPASLKMHLSDFRAALNTFIAAVEKYKIPATMAYLARKVFMYRSVYLENPFGNIKDQLYQFVPAGFWMYKLHQGTNQSWGQLSFIPLQTGVGGYRPNVAYPNRTTLLTWEQVINYGREMLSRIKQYGEDDFALISGDIVKAYGSALITMELVPEEAGLAPVYDPYVLSQMKNATLVGPLDYYHSTSTGYDGGCRLAYKVNGETYFYGDVDQNPVNGFLLAGNAICPNNDGEAALGATASKYLSVENPLPEEGDVMEATRLMVALHKDIAHSDSFAEKLDGTVAVVEGTKTLIQLSCGSDAVVGMNIDRHGMSTVSVDSSYISPYVFGNSVQLLYHIAATAVCKYAPTLFGLGLTVTTNDVTLNNVFPVSNLDNATVLDGNEVEKLHRAALFNLLYVPTVAKSLNI